MIGNFISSLLSVSVTGGIFILAAILVRSGMKQRLPKHFLVLLWAAVLLHLLFLVGAPSPTSIYNYIAFRSPALPGAADAPVAAAPLDAAIAAPEMFNNAPAASGGSSMPTIVFCIWLAGALGLFAAFLGSYISTRRRFATAFVLKNHPAVEAWRARLKNPPTVLVSDRTSVPLSYGLTRPCIVLPSGFDLSNNDQVESVLEHERIHGRDYHNIMKVLVAAAVIVHWFNPLVWLYWFLFNHDVELACDERVIRSIGPSRRAQYAHSLVAVAEKAAIPFPLVSAFSARNLRERVVDVMGYKPTTLPLLALELLLIVCLFALFGTSSVSIAASANTGQNHAAMIAEITRETGEPPATVLTGTADTESAQAQALALTGGGIIVKHEIERDDGVLVHSFGIVSNGYEYQIEIDPLGRTVLKHDRKRMKKGFEHAQFESFISMEDASARAIQAVGGGTVVECELKHGKPGDFWYEVEIIVNRREREVHIDAVTGALKRIKN